MKNVLFFTCFLFGFIEMHAQGADPEIKKKQEAIIEKYITNGAKTTNYTTKEYQEWVNKGLKEDSTFYELYPYQITWEWNGVE
jgi:hypothetical protein